MATDALIEKIIGTPSLPAARATAISRRHERVPSTPMGG